MFPNTLSTSGNCHYHYHYTCKCFRNRFFRISSPIVSKIGLGLALIAFILNHPGVGIFLRQTHIKCMIKIPSVFGDSNINLTKEYVQEEGVTNSGLDDEEKLTNVCYYRFRICLFLNSLIIKHLHGWSYHNRRIYISISLYLRKFQNSQGSFQFPLAFLCRNNWQLNIDWNQSSVPGSQSLPQLRILPLFFVWF